jgi:hypothetical protein
LKGEGQRQRLPDDMPAAPQHGFTPVENGRNRTLPFGQWAGAVARPSTVFKELSTSLDSLKGQFRRQSIHD